MTAVIKDNGGAGFSDTGGWTLTSGSILHTFEGADYQYAAADPGVGGQVSTWAFTGLTGGVLVYLGATWEAAGNRATNSKYKVYDSDGTTLLATFTAHG